MSGIRERTGNLCRRFQLEVPILLAPMSGLPAPGLSGAVANAGGLGAGGVLLISPEEIVAWTGHAAAMARADAAARLVKRLWHGACDLLDAADLTAPAG